MSHECEHEAVASKRFTMVMQGGSLRVIKCMGLKIRKAFLFICRVICRNQIFLLPKYLVDVLFSVSFSFRHFLVMEVCPPNRLCSCRDLSWAERGVNPRYVNPHSYLYFLANVRSPSSYTVICLPNIHISITFCHFHLHSRLHFKYTNTHSAGQIWSNCSQLKISDSSATEKCVVCGSRVGNAFLATLNSGDNL